MPISKLTPYEHVPGKFCCCVESGLTSKTFHILKHLHDLPLASMRFTQVWYPCVGRIRTLHPLTTILCAAAVGSLDIVKLLLSLDATHSKLDNKGRSPLYAAALAGHPDIVKALLDAGADHGKAPSPLHFVQDPKVLAVLLEDGADEEDSTKDGETPLLAALRCGYMEVS